MNRLILDLGNKKKPVPSYRATNSGSQMREDGVIQEPFLEPTALKWDDWPPSIGPVR